MLSIGHLHCPQLRVWHFSRRSLCLEAACTFSQQTSPTVNGMILVVGSPNLTGLLLSRLGMDVEAVKKAAGAKNSYDISYDELEKAMSQQERQRWPRALHELLAADDSQACDKILLAKSMHGVGVTPG